jgi:hypothetical protein
MVVSVPEPSSSTIMRYRAPSADRIDCTLVSGVDAAAVHDVLAGKVVGGFIIADRDEFQRVKQEMEDSINKETKFMSKKVIADDEEKALKILQALNDADVAYGLDYDGSMYFLNDEEKKRGEEIIAKIENGI